MDCVDSCVCNSGAVYRGTNPEIRFKLWFDVDVIDINNSYVSIASGTYSQRIPIVIENGEVVVKLTSEQTLQFTGSQANFQLLITIEQAKMVSEIFSFEVKDIVGGNEQW